MSIKTGADLIAEAKSRIRLVPLEEMRAAIGTPAAPTFLDVREPNETNLGRIPGAIVIPRGQMETRVESLVPRDAYLVVYCATDNRSALAVDTLQQMGYRNVACMRGGFNGWAISGGPVER